MFGTGEVGLRSLSALLGTATVPAAYAAADTFVTRRSALIAAALVAVSPLLVWYSQEARAYALLVLLGTLSLVFFRQALARGGRPLTWWAVSASLALATHYFAIFLVAAEGALLLAGSASRRAVRWAVGTTTLVGAALAPLAVYQAENAEHTAWISNSVRLSGRVAYLLHQLVVGVYPIDNIWPLVVAAPLVVLVGLLTWTEPRERTGALLVGSLGLVAVGGPLALAALGDAFFGGRGDYFIYRNLIVAVVPLTIAAAAAAGTASAGRAGSLVAAVACLLLVAVSIDIARRPELQRPDGRGVARALGPAPAGRAIVADIRTAAILKLYLPDAHEVARASVRELAVIGEEGHPLAPSAAGFRQLQLAPVQMLRLRGCARVSRDSSRHPNWRSSCRKVARSPCSSIRRGADPYATLDERHQPRGRDPPGEAP